MNKKVKFPPSTKNSLISGNELARLLAPLVGEHFSLRGQIRTRGANLRKSIETIIVANNIAIADENEFSLMVKKGQPKLMAVLADSYLVTSGDCYNLQVWNRRPSSRVQLLKYADGTKFTCKDVRYILVKVNTDTEIIESIIVATPDYIEKKFGDFGVPTVKYQLIINSSKRGQILDAQSKMLTGEDTNAILPLLATKPIVPHETIASAPKCGEVLPISIIKKRVASKLIGKKLAGQDTKTRGQELERLVASLIGYSDTDSLVGGYPDIRNQALEVKVQVSPTIDLGRETPSFPTAPFEGLTITTEDVRYLIGLLDPKTKKIEGIVLMSGRDIVEEFSLVGSTSYKCQRSIPMSFFDQYKGKSVFNP